MNVQNYKMIIIQHMFLRHIPTYLPLYQTLREYDVCIDRTGRILLIDVLILQEN